MSVSFCCSAASPLGSLSSLLPLDRRQSVAGHLAASPPRLDQVLVILRLQRCCVRWHLLSRQHIAILIFHGFVSELLSRHYLHLGGVVHVFQQVWGTRRHSQQVRHDYVKSGGSDCCSQSLRGSLASCGTSRSRGGKTDSRESGPLGGLHGENLQEQLGLSLFRLPTSSARLLAQTSCAAAASLERTARS